MTDTDNTVGELIPRPNGRGSLRRGNPGNKGGTGRPPKEVMSRSRALYERVLGELEAKLEQAGAALTPEQLVTVGSMAGRYAGLGDDVTHTISIGSLHLAALQATPYTPRIAATATTDDTPKQLQHNNLPHTEQTPKQGE